MPGCLLALLVAGALLLVGGIGIAIFVYVQFREFVGATADLVKIVARAQNAPGTKEMRSVGCDQAFALDLGEIGEALERFEREIARREDRPPKSIDLEGHGHMLVCKVNKNAGPSCQAVAETFVRATRPTSALIVSVEYRGSQGCSERFDASGRSLGEAEAIDLPLE